MRVEGSISRPAGFEDEQENEDEDGTRIGAGLANREPCARPGLRA